MCRLNSSQKNLRKMDTKTLNQGAEWTWLRCTLLLIFLPSIFLSSSAADEATAHFENRIRPVLVERCIECHGAEKQKGGLRLDSREGWVKGGDSGEAIVPGEVEKSVLIKALRYTDADLKMPPEKKGGKLSVQEIADFETWVKAGAPDPRSLADAPVKRAVADPKTFWSFQPVRAVTPPTVSRSEWVKTPVDAFLLAKLDAAGLTPAPPADARTLVRRAYFDLLGLPPTPQQVDVFVNDTAPDAFARLVDSLLESKQYGERWGRHWLDVARYADSGGFETDMYYRNAWRYRDYVVKSFNDDKPYDRFVQEQIAGDELWPDNLQLDGNYTIAPEKVRHLEALTGTGLYALGPQVHESNMDGKKIHYETFADWVDTTGAAFMGLTVGCARGHDHKFDPVSQRDYYAMQAIFSGSKEVEVPIIDAMGLADFKQHYPRILAVEEARRALRLFDGRTTGRALSAPEQAERQELLNGIANNVLALPEQSALGVPLVGLMETPTVSVLGHERPELVPAIHLLNRGELSRPREQITAALPESLAAASSTPAALPGPQGSRAALARWLTDPRHPLTARVLVNRVWHWHFGRGLVASLNDFGQMGERPSHPELLDWLAGEFVRGGWSIKKLHRVMMLSSAYQMDSRTQNDRAAQADPQNRLLWKANRRRLEAEALWDAMHAVAGTLNLKMGGRPVVPPLAADEGAPGNWTVSADPAEHTRRGLYILQRRNFRFPMFDVFDLPVNAVTAPARDVTTVAPQALWLLNNRTAQRQSEALAARLIGSTNGWNQPGFGPGQPGWPGVKAGIHAGWAKRIETENTTPDFDDPRGTVLTHGPTSVAWRAPAGTSGTAEISGALWNIRRLNRTGPWKLWKNDTLLAEGTLDDKSGSSAAPLAFTRATTIQPGDTLRLEILEDDFAGVRLNIKTPQRTHDIAADFSLDANPTPHGWQYSESLANGGGPLPRVLLAKRLEDPAALVEAAWRTALGRAPTAEEKAEAIALLKSLNAEQPHAALAQLCLALFNLQEFSYAD
jgi:mono/diheme cytochrome c family protein